MQITIIGGGSYQWTPELLADLLGTESLRGAHYVLEDIDPVPLAKMEVARPEGRRRPGGGGDIRHHHRSAPGARGRRLRDRHHLHRRLRLDGGGPGCSRPLRHPPVGGRHRRAGRYQPVPAEHSGAGGRGGGHGQDLPGRLAAQHHQSDDLSDPGRLPADRGQDGGPVPRGRQLDHGPGHRPGQAARGGPANGGRRQPLPGGHRPRRRRRGRLRHPRGDGGRSRRAGRPGPRSRPAQGRRVHPARLRPAPRARSSPCSTSGEPCPRPATATSPSSCPGC